MIEVLSHDERNATDFIELGTISFVLKAISLAEEHGQQTTLDNAFSLLAFYTHHEKLWLTIARPQIVRIMCSYLNGHDEVNAYNKFVKDSSL